MTSLNVCVRPGAALMLSLVACTPAAARSNWSIDPSRTHIGFAVEAVGWPRTTGTFGRFEGRIVVDFDHPGLSRVSFRVEAASVDVGSAGFSDYVKSAVLLDAAHFPTIDFVSTSVEKLDGRHVRVAGDMTLLGVARPVSVDVDVERLGAGARLGFVAHARIDRLAFGMNSGFPVISRDVDLVISSEAFEP